MPMRPSSTRQKGSEELSVPRCCATSVVAPNRLRCTVGRAFGIVIAGTFRLHGQSLGAWPMKSFGILTVALLWTTISLAALPPASAQSTFDIDEQRAATLKKMESVIPDPVRLREIAKETFSKPLSSQDVDVLKSLARQSNSYANMVGFIKEGYEDSFRRNHSYDFVIEKLSPPLQSYRQVANEFLGIRNQAYFNLGMKDKAAGNNVEALIWFRDAFRLSSFECEDRQAPEKCMRWRAEQELQKLLGLSSIKAYVTWQ